MDRARNVGSANGTNKNPESSSWKENRGSKYVPTAVKKQRTTWFTSFSLWGGHELVFCWRLIYSRTTSEANAGVSERLPVLLVSTQVL
jgi:hypothetical protein